MARQALIGTAVAVACALAMSAGAAAPSLASAHGQPHLTDDAAAGQSANQRVINTRRTPMVLSWIDATRDYRAVRRPKNLGFYDPVPYPVVRKMTWRGWGTPRATGIGVLNECGPRYRNGAYIGDSCRRLRAVVKLTRIAIDGCGEGAGAWIYTRFVVRTPASHRNDLSGRLTIC